MQDSSSHGNRPKYAGTCLLQDNGSSITGFRMIASSSKIFSIVDGWTFDFCTKIPWVSSLFEYNKIIFIKYKLSY